MSLGIPYTFAAGLLFSVYSLQSSLDGCSVKFFTCRFTSSFFVLRSKIFYCLHFILQINTASLFLDVCVLSLRFLRPLEVRSATWPSF